MKPFQFLANISNLLGNNTAGTLLLCDWLELAAWARAHCNS